MKQYNKFYNLGLNTNNYNNYKHYFLYSKYHGLYYSFLTNNDNNKIIVKGFLNMNEENSHWKNLYNEESIFKYYL